MSKGLLMVFTGKGKGKTTAAMGAVFRALGHDWSICVIQFIKGKWHSGEQTAAKRFADLMEVHVLGRGFTWQSEDLDKDIKIAQEAWEFAKEKIRSGKCNLIVLDELTYLVKYGMVDEKEVISVLTNRPDDLHVIVTGRDAPASLVETADLVSEINDVKHHFHEGIKAQKGIEF